MLNSCSFAGFQEIVLVSTLQANGSLNSLTNTISWNPANEQELSIVEPGEEGNLSLEVRLKDDFPIRRLSDKNFTLRVEGQIESPTVPEGISASKTVSLSSIETKIAGKATITTKVFFRDAISKVVNSGPYPPRVNVATQYTVHWSITNYSTDISDVVVSASLQSGTEFVKVVSTNGSVEPEYDAAAREITWRLSAIPSTKGVIGTPVTVVFQIANTPAVNQINQTIPLLGETRLKANDNFTGLTIQASVPPKMSNLPDDPTVQSVASKGVQP